jgi:hypothetical protein
MLVNHLLHTEIDKEKWDNALQNSHNSMVYANSWYLDAMCPYWEALVIDNYAYIMPIPVKNKFGIKYIYQPFLTAQLGIFSQHTISLEITELFFKQLEQVANYAEYDCNYACPILKQNCTIRQNYILPFNGTQLPYKAHALNYKRLAIRKLNKAAQANLSISYTINSALILDLCKANNIKKQINYASHVYNDAALMLKHAQQLGILYTIGAVNPNGQLLASIAYLCYNNRIFSLIAGNVDAGNACGAFYFVLDALIQRYANTNYVLDFEGSDIEGIAFVFKNLGGQPQPYYYYKHNNLPFPLNIIKK